MSEYAQIPGTGVEDDLALIKLVLAGDRRAFEPLVRKHERRVFRVTLAVLGNVEDAEEAMQDAFIKAFRHLDQFRGESRFTTWLTRIAVNEALQKR
jgi:RNA polymerase sigma-70 factor (ECF subfamily)